VTTLERPRTAASLAAEAAFHVRVAGLGGRVLEATWLGAGKPHRVVCKEGHESTPRPANLAKQGICRICSGLDPSSGEQSFRARVAELGGQILEPNWLGSKVRHRVICAHGHEVRALPNSVQQGQGLCLICAGKDPVTAERKFRENVAARGGLVLDIVWLGSSTPHRVLCDVGHESTVYPYDLASRPNLCSVCIGHSTPGAEKKFRDRVAELGGRVIEPLWLGSAIRHRVICPRGHGASVLPNSVQQGRGICRKCTGYVWDTFYVVVDGTNHRVKFGITTDDPRPRLATHRRAGYSTNVCVMRDLDRADLLEAHVLRTLEDARVIPVQGREYYDVSALPLILDVADHWEVAA
jgi:hypothetical protein